MMGKGKVINWLKRKFTAGGKRRRDELIDQYFERFQRTPPPLNEQEQFDQKNVYSRIWSDIGNMRIKAVKRRATLFTAASLTLICLAGIFLVKKQQHSGQDGTLLFASAPLADVLASVERKYHIVIHAAPNIRGCKVNVDFTNESKEKVLQVLAGLVNGKAAYREGAYQLTGEGCSDPFSVILHGSLPGP